MNSRAVPRATDPFSASFRDPSGFVFQQDGEIYRQVNRSYKEDYDHLIASGLYAALVKAEALVQHEEIGFSQAPSEDAYKILKPKRVPFISYPYEWCFSQLKDAALLTLEIQKRALDFGASLKDCSAYNVQFAGGKPIFIDTLSFERYRPGEPWVGYRQFCQHFVAPLALMSWRDARLNQLLQTHLDGIPLDLAGRLLPIRSYLRFGIFLHIHAHARSQVRHSSTVVEHLKSKRFTLRSLYGLIESLQACVRNMTGFRDRAVWADYYSAPTSYDSVSIEHKQKLVSQFLDLLKPASVWDFGANTGLFSRLASDRGIPTVAFDSDPACVEINYRATVSKGERNLLPLLMDLTNPSPELGWENRERMSIWERGPADAGLALAVIHHWAIANNVPLDRIASFFTRACRSLIVEFVPKSDPMVQRLLAGRKDIFPHYDVDGFERAFRDFVAIRKERIKKSDRTLYLMRPAGSG